MQPAASDMSETLPALEWVGLDRRVADMNLAETLLRDGLARDGGNGLLPSKWVPITAGTLPDSHAGYLRFCPANSQLYRTSAKLSQDNHGIDLILLLADGL